MKRTFTPRKLKKILFVSDDLTAASLYQEKLESQRHDVEIVGDGQRGLQIIEIAPVDLVILDLSNSGIRGVETLRAIRSQAGALPVIVLSNHYFGGQLEAARKAGATRCVTKADCTPRQLAAIVRETFARGPSGTVSELAGAVAVSSTPAEMAFEAKVAQLFLDDAPQIIAKLRSGHRAFVNSHQEELRLAELSEMHRQTGILAGAAGLAGFRRIAQLSSALEALLLQLRGDPSKITSPVIRTLAQAGDLLAALFARNPQTEAAPLTLPKILVVNDEVTVRETICGALEAAGLPSVCVDEAETVTALLEQSRFDLIFLDIEMRGRNGLELCSAIRKLPMNRATPVLFVTSHCDLATRARSSLSGGSDFIAKPFLPAELAVKALTWLFRDKPPAPFARIAVSVATAPGQVQTRQTREIFQEALKHAC